MDAKVLLVAAKLRLFDELQNGPLAGRQISERLGLHPRAIPDFPDALVALGPPGTSSAIPCRVPI